MKYTAYGVEPNRRATYELRQSRYQALGEEVVKEVQRIRQSSNHRIKLLDVGVWDGISRRYIEAYPASAEIDFEGVDIFPHGEGLVYKHEAWTLHHQDLMEGMPHLETARYDIVICEQVLEHLHHVQPAIHDMTRVLKPGGMMIIGVPIFPHGVHLIRRHVVPVLDKTIKLKKHRGHVQAWSLKTFRREWESQPDIQFKETRGFRIVSGGLLRPLEFTKTWWRLNRMIGAAVPSLCTEVQMVGRKAA
jgi:SAM-dependent methyltransferase